MVALERNQPRKARIRFFSFDSFDGVTRPLPLTNSHLCLVNQLSLYDLQKMPIAFGSNGDFSGQRTNLPCTSLRSCLREPSGCKPCFREP